MFRVPTEFCHGLLYQNPRICACSGRPVYAERRRALTGIPVRGPWSPVIRIAIAPESPSSSACVSASAFAHAYARYGIVMLLGWNDTPPRSGCFHRLERTALSPATRGIGGHRLGPNTAPTTAHCRRPGRGSSGTCRVEPRCRPGIAASRPSPSPASGGTSQTHPCRDGRHSSSTAPSMHTARRIH